MSTTNLFQELVSEDDNMAVLQEFASMDDTMNSLGESVSETAFSEDAYIDGNDIETPVDEKDIDKMQVFSQDHVGAKVSDDALDSYDPDRQPNNSNSAFVPDNLEEGIVKLVLGEDYEEVKPGSPLLREEESVDDEDTLQEADEDDLGDIEEAELEDIEEDDDDLNDI